MSTKLNNAIRKLDTLDKEVSRIEKLLNAAKQKYAAQQEVVITQMDKEELEIAGTPACRVKIRETEHWSIGDYDRFARYVLRNRALELFQNRISKRALEEKLEQGRKVPGITKFTKRAISFTRKAA